MGSNEEGVMEDADRTVKLGFSPGHLDAKIECPKCKGHMGVCVSFEDWEEIGRDGRALVELRKTIADAAELFTMAIAEGAAVAFEGQPWPTGETTHEGMHAWLARPEVVAARKR